MCSPGDSHIDLTWSALSSDFSSAIFVLISRTFASFHCKGTTQFSWCRIRQFVSILQLSTGGAHALEDALEKLVKKQFKPMFWKVCTKSKTITTMCFAESHVYKGFVWLNTKFIFFEPTCKNLVLIKTLTIDASIAKNLAWLSKKANSAVKRGFNWVCGLRSFIAINPPPHDTSWRQPCNTCHNAAATFFVSELKYAPSNEFYSTQNAHSYYQNGEIGTHCWSGPVRLFV